MNIDRTAPHRKAASECYLALLDEQLPADRWKAWIDWLQERPEHQAAFDEVGRLWNALDRVGPLELPPQEALRADRSDAGTIPGPERRRFFSPRIGYALAASVLITIGALLTFKPWQGLLPQEDSYATALGEIATYTLVDGSKVTLAGDSALETVYSRRGRTITLRKGQGYFEVAKDPDRPFVVRAHGGTATAVGTEFDVMDDTDGFTVTVMRGLVQVDGRDAVGRSAGDGAHTVTTVVGQGEQVSFTEAAGLSGVHKIDTDASGSWRHGVLTFVAEPLPRAIEAVNRYARHRIYYRAEELRDLSISGTVYIDRADEWVRGLEQGYPISVQAGETGSVLITRRTDALSQPAFPNPH